MALDTMNTTRPACGEKEGARAEVEQTLAALDEARERTLALVAPLDDAEIERVHRMLGELGPEEGARRYAAELLAGIPTERTSTRGPGPPVLDLIVLGIGEDGHVASLFPDAPTLADESGVCLPVRDSPKPPPERITLSLSVLRAARRCLLLATDASKADAVTAMVAEPSPRVPASLLRRERLTVIVDDAAAPTAGRR